MILIQTENISLVFTCPYSKQFFLTSHDTECPGGTGSTSVEMTRRSKIHRDVQNPRNTRREPDRTDRCRVASPGRGEDELYGVPITGWRGG